MGALTAGARSVRVCSGLRLRGKASGTPSGHLCTLHPNPASHPTRLFTCSVVSLLPECRRVGIIRWDHIFWAWLLSVMCIYCPSMSFHGSMAYLFLASERYLAWMWHRFLAARPRKGVLAAAAFWRWRVELPSASPRRCGTRRSILQCAPGCTSASVFSFM